MKKEELRKDWETRIADFKASGKTQIKWCSDNHLNIHQLRYWLKRFSSNERTKAKPLSNSNWLAINVEDQTMARAPLIVKIGDVSIEVKPGYDPALFLDIIRKLKSIC